jgi:hypothetical protein
MLREKGFSPMPLAFPYIRYSSIGQADGSSAERQLALAQALAERHNLTLQPAIEDLGRSAATGANLTAGPLADFFARVHSGQVPRGSWLIVEDPDRISRGNPQTALNVLSDLVNAGLAIGYSRTGEVIQQGSSWSNFLLTYINLGRANEENLRKQQLCRAGWKAAKLEAAAEGRALTRVCPLWLKIDSEGRFVPIPDRVALIHRMYNEAITLGYGGGRIAQRLNAEGIPMWQSVTMPTRRAGADWDPAYVAKILSQRTVLGDFQPKNKNIDTGKRARPDGPPIPNFYPAVVDLVTWQRAQASRGSRRGSGGVQREAVSNLLSGLTKCAACGASMTLRTGKKGRTVGSYGSPRGSYLICRNRLRGTCRGTEHFLYPPIEDAVIDLLRSRLLGRRQYSDEQRDLELSLAQIADQIEIDNQNAAALIRPGESLSGVRLRMLEEIEARVLDAETRRSNLEQQLAVLIGSRDGDDVAREVDGILGQMASADLTVREQARTIAQAAIRSLIDQVQCCEDGLITIRLGGGSAEITLREIDRVRRIARIWVKRGGENQIKIYADRAAIWASRGRPYTTGLDRGFEIQIARWVAGLDGVLSEDEIRRLDEGYTPSDPRDALRDAKRFLEDLRDDPERARALIAEMEDE